MKNEIFHTGNVFLSCQKGEIVEDGSHDDLLANDGEYTRLYSTQAQWYDR